MVDFGEDATIPWIASISSDFSKDDPGSFVAGRKDLLKFNLPSLEDLLHVLAVPYGIKLRCQCG
jgi:hypothetical protein